MKRILLYLFAVLLSSTIILSQGKITFQPEKPQAGKDLTVIYSPTNSKLSECNDIKMVVYQFKVAIFATEEVVLNKSGNDWVGKVNLADSARGGCIKFYSGEITDNNSGKGFSFNCYDNSGKPVVGSSASVGITEIMYGSLLELDIDKEAVIRKVLDEIKAEPKLREEYIVHYIPAVLNALKDKGVDVIKAELNNFKADPETLNETTLATLFSAASRVGSDKADSFKKVIDKKYPFGMVYQQSKVTEFRQLKDIEAKKKLFNDFKTNVKESNFLGMFINTIVNDLSKAGKFAEAEEFLSANGSFANANTYNSLAYALFEKGDNLQSAEKLSSTAVSKMSSEYEKPSSPKPTYISQSEFVKNLNYSLAMFLDTYGSILLKLNKNVEALEALNESVKLSEAKEAEINENHIKALNACEKYEDLIVAAEEYYKSDSYTEPMKDLLKNAYEKSNNKNESFDVYFDKLLVIVKAKRFEELKKQMLNEDAPQFTLMDLDGKKVSLADYKGKTVVVDFWATWCGPCLASFPGMKKAVEKFETSGNVKFLFVNTWERVENKKQNAIDFIKKNNYPFQVLLDDNNEVITKYKVLGIPTKFFVDKNAKIKFKSVGFSGNPDKMVDEIGTILEMIQ